MLDVFVNVIYIISKFLPWIAAGSTNCCTFVGFLNPCSISALTISSGSLNSAQDNMSSLVRFVTLAIFSPSFGFLTLLAFTCATLTFLVLSFACSLFSWTSFAFDGVTFLHVSTIKPLLSLIFFWGTSTPLSFTLFSVGFLFFGCLF